MPKSDIVKSIDGIGYFIALIPTTIFFVTVARHTPNIPYGDDYDAILVTLLRFQQATGWREIILLITARHNEHCIALCRIAAILDYLVFGKVNFVRLALYGDFFLVGIALVMIRAAGVWRQAMAWPPVFLTLFGLRHYESEFWAMAALSNYAVIFFAFLAVYFLTQEKQTCFLAACLSAAAGSFSQANGILVFPIGLVSLIWWKRYSQALVWLAVFSVIAFAYFSIPSTDGAHMTPSTRLSATLKFFFIFLGSVSDSPRHALIIGAIAAVTVTVLAIWPKTGSNKPLALISAFILITALAAAAGRTGFGTLTALASRYSIYSTLILTTIYLSLAKTSNYTLLPAIFLACYFCIRSYNQELPKQIDRYEMLHRAHRQEGSGYVGLFYPPSEQTAERILATAEALMIYRLPPSHKNPEPAPK